MVCTPLMEITVATEKKNDNDIEINYAKKASIDSVSMNRCSHITACCES